MHKRYPQYRIVSLYLLALSFLGVYSAEAQYVVTNNNNAMQLAQDIAGVGIEVSNAQLTCDSRGVGTYTAAGTNLPIFDGIILSTGDIQNPKAGGLLTEGTDFGTGGYAPLSGPAGTTTLNDGCVLEFDLLARSNQLQFNFTFASNEYLEYVGSSFNDAFGFFISGPGIVGAQNLAVIGTAPITINTVNNVANAASYIDNPNFNPVPYDGFTTRLVASANVQSCGTYHLVIAITDASDGSWDSSVYLESSSLTSIGVDLDAPIVSGTLGGGRVYEQCDSATFVFELDQTVTTDFVFPIAVKGTASRGVDFRDIADSVIVKAGTNSASVVILPLTDLVADAGETVEICVLDPCTGDELVCQSVSIEELLIDPIDEQFLCYGDTVQLETQFNANYNYNWTPGTGLSCTTCNNPLAYPTDTTTYYYTVSDKTCSIMDSVTVNVAAEKLPNPIDTIACEGYITEIKDYSTPGFITYTWTPNTTGISSTSGPSPFFTVLDSAVLYTVTAENDYGCILTEDILIDVHAPVEAVLTTVDILCKYDSTGSIFVNVASATPIDSFIWDTNPMTLGNPIANIPEGDYAVRIVDLNGCTLDLDTTLLEPDDELIVLAEELKPSECGNKNGLAIAEVTGGTLPYNQGLWTPEGGVNLQTDSLFAGIYEYAMTDANGCPAKDTAEIHNDVSGMRDATISQIGPFCLGDAATQIPFIDAGGTWAGTGVDSDGLFDPIAAGSGTHTITYDFGYPCISHGEIVVQVNSSFQADINPVQPLCPLDGSITLTSVNPGGKWYGPGISSPDSTSPVFDPMSAGSGTHKVYHLIEGSCGELDSLDIVVTAIDSAQITMPQDFCPTGLPAGIVAMPSGGTWSGTGIMSNGTFDPTLTGSGSFQIKYTPSGVCYVADSLNVTVVDTLRATAQTVNVLCNGDLASVTTTVIGGQTPYSFAWVGDGANTSSTASNQPAGSYDVTVTDNTGCSETVQHIINEPTKLDSTSVSQVTDVSCPSGNDGAIEVYIGGGTPGYAYSISPSGTNNGDGTFSNLTAGSYTITVTDANNCQITATAGVAQPSPIVIAGTPQTAYCNLPNGSVTGVSVTGGTPGASPNYTYLWDNGQTTADLTNVVPGTYVLTVTDGNNCTEQATFIVPNAGGASLVGTMDSVVCFGGSTGKAWVTPSGGQLPYLYRWNSGETTDTIYNKPAGIYNIEVEDGTGCKTNINIEIKEPSKVDVAPVADQTLCYAQIYTTTLSGSNGNGAPYTYTANGVLQTADEYLDSLARTVTVIAYDQYGCASDPTQFSISYLAPLSLQMPLPDSVCPGVEVTKLPIPSGGNGNYSYAWSDGTTTLQNDYTSLLNEGSDSITLTISDGCSPDYTDTTVIYIYSVNDISVLITPPEGCEPLDVRFEILNAGFQNPIWDMGDGNIITDDMVIDYVYPIRGDYPIGLSGRTAEGCPVSANIDIINVYPIPEGEILQSPDRITVINNLGLFKVRSETILDSIYWNLQQYQQSIFTTEGQVLTYEFARDTSNYFLEAEIVSNKGCRNTIFKPFRVFSENIIYAPSAFTPNGDGVNDLFFVETIGVKAENFKLAIYDRWGEELFSTEDLNFQWDGVYRLKELMTGMYIWKMEFETVNGTQESESGRVYLLR